MKKKSIFTRIGPLLVGALLLCLNAQAQGPYHYWPDYYQTPIEDIRQDLWVVSDSVADDWDWSLPPGTAPAPISKLMFARNSSLTLDKVDQLPTVNFACNPVVTHWLNWKDLEPTNDTYKWDELKTVLDASKAKGYTSVIRIMTCRVERSAPQWIVDLDLPKIYYDGLPDNTNFDPADPTFHQHYIDFVTDFGTSGIPARDDVIGLFVGYASKSWGDEGIGPHGGESNPAANDTVQHVRERLDAWAAITDGMRDKMVMGGYSNYGFSLGFGIRRGFVEHYMYHTPDAVMGQLLDANTYLYVDENNAIVANNLYNGEENEEYEEKWLDRFGPTDGYPYRYFSSNIRLLQMRCNAVLYNPFSIMPEMLAWVGLELGRTRDDAPDAWCFLRETYIRNGVNDRVKNFERWLHQRDTPGYETQAVIPVDKNYDSWMYSESYPEDLIARKGQKIGFAADDLVFPTDVEHSVAIKVSYIDNVTGTLKLVYRNNSGPQEKTITTTGGDVVRTATFFVDATFDASDFDYDFELHFEAGKEVPVSFVRVIKVPPAVDVTGVTVSPETLTLGIGKTGELAATVLPYNATDQSVQWSSTDTLVATVDPNGVVTALAVGSANIVAATSDGMFTDTCKLDVFVVTVDEIVNVSVPKQVHPGDTITALIDYEATETRDIRVFIQLNSPPWDSYGSTTVTVDAGAESISIDFIVSPDIPLAANAYKIVVDLLPVGGSWPDRLYEIRIENVSAVAVPVPVESVSIDHCPPGDLTEGDTHQLTATVVPADASNPSISWNSSDPSVLTVDANGFVSALSAGTASITVTTNDGGFTSSCEVSVKLRPVDGVNIDQCPSGDLTEGDTYPLTATVVPANASNLSVSWDSSDPSVLTVDANGFVTAVHEGTATITVTTLDGGFTSACEVTVVAPIDRITDAVIPDQVFPGDTVTVYAQYESSQSRDIGASIQLNSEPWTNYGSNTRTVLAGIGNDSVDFVVSPGIPIADNAYKIVLYLLPVGGDWNESLHEFEKINVSVVEDTLTSTNEKYRSANFTGPDNAVFKVYPNPVSDILYLEVWENCSVQLTTVGGRVIYQGKAGSSMVALDVSALNYKGIVLVQILSEKQVSTFRTIIE